MFDFADVFADVQNGVMPSRICLLMRPGGVGLTMVLALFLAELRWSELHPDVGSTASSFSNKPEGRTPVLEDDGVHSVAEAKLGVLLLLAGHGGEGGRGSC